MDEKTVNDLAPKLTAETIAQCCEAIARMCQIARDAFAVCAEGFRKLSERVAMIADDWFVRLLYAANKNPKWWHLYKHAKKRRTRKKYYHMLVQQYLETLQT